MLTELCDTTLTLSILLNCCCCCYCSATTSKTNTAPRHIRNLCVCLFYNITSQSLLHCMMWSVLQGYCLYMCYWTIYYVQLTTEWIIIKLGNFVLLIISRNKVKGALFIWLSIYFLHICQSVLILSLKQHLQDKWISMSKVLQKREIGGPCLQRISLSMRKFCRPGGNRAAADWQMIPLAERSRVGRKILFDLIWLCVFLTENWKLWCWSPWVLSCCCLKNTVIKSLKESRCRMSHSKKKKNGLLVFAVRAGLTKWNICSCQIQYIVLEDLHEHTNFH